MNYAVYITIHHVKKGKLKPKKRVVRLAEHLGLIDVKNGFWINRAGNYTQGSDAIYWVPPSQILCIRKIS